MRLIDADALIDKIMQGEYNPHDATYYADLTDKFPTVDAVQAVRCKDCKWWDAKPDEYGHSECMNLEGAWPTGDWYCKDGEKIRSDTKEENQ